MMRDAHPGNFLAVAWYEMRLCDPQILTNVQFYFKAVNLGSPYHLRLPSERLCLAVPEVSIVQNKVMKRTMKGAGIMALAVAGPFGIAIVGGAVNARHFWKQKKAVQQARKLIARIREPGAMLSFVAVSDSKTSYDQNDVVQSCVMEC